MIPNQPDENPAAVPNPLNGTQPKGTAPAYEEICLDRAHLQSLTAEYQTFAKPEWSLHWVRTKKQLEKLGALLEKAELFAVDTETWGPRDLSEKLCLLQIGVPNSSKRKDGTVEVDMTQPGKTFLVDVLALKREADKETARTGEDVNYLEPLRKAMENLNTTKLIQHSQFERGQFEKYQIKINGILDLERISKQVRDDLISYSLQAQALELCGILQDKESQKSPWDKRPLTPKQIEYAALDPEMNVVVWAKIQGIVNRLEKEVRAALPSLSMDDLLNKVRENHQAHYALLEKSGMREAVDFLIARSEKYRQVLKEERLPAEYEKLKKQAEAEGRELPAGAGFEYKGIYGSARYKALAELALDLEKLKSIDPTLVDEVSNPKTSKEAIKAAIKALPPELQKESDFNLIWKDIYRDTGRWTKPSLKIELAGLPPEADMKKLMAEIDVPEDMGVEDLLRGIIETEATRLKLLRDYDIGNELGFLRASVRIYEEEILTRLVAAAQKTERPFEGAHQSQAGTASFSSRPISAVDFERLATKYPEIAKLAVSNRPSIEKLEEAMRQRKFDPQTTERLRKECLKESGKFGNPSAKIHPYFGLYYKGLKEDPLEAEMADGDGTMIH